VEKSGESEPTNLLNPPPNNSTQNHDNPSIAAYLPPISGRIRGNPPRFGDVLLAYYSTGLFNGGGCSYCAKAGKRRYPRIEVAMCDKDALDPVGRWWGVQMGPRGKEKVCANGPAYQIAAVGSRAEMIMNEMMKYGLSNRKIEQWRKVLSLCRQGALFVPR
jgi:hypothetical protein